VARTRSAEDWASVRVAMFPTVRSYVSAPIRNPFTKRKQEENEGRGTYEVDLEERGFSKSH
jgi:hypothetical protein